MGVESAVMAGLFGRLAALIFSPALPIEWPDVAFTRPQASPTTRYLRATMLPGTAFPLAVAASGSNQHPGLMQIDVFQGIGGGEAPMVAIADQIIAHFARGTRIQQDGVQIDIVSPPYRLPLQRVDGDPWVMVPVRVPYVVIATNAA